MTLREDTTMTSSAPQVSVYLPTRNRVSLLQRGVDSVLAQGCEFAIDFRKRRRRCAYPWQPD